MNAAQFRDTLSRLGLSQGDAARLLGVKLRTVQRWAAGLPAVGEPAAQALRAWCLLAERGIAWRPDEVPVGPENLAGVAQARRLELGWADLSRPGATLRRSVLRWRVNIGRCRASSRTMVVHFNRLADGGFIPGSYRRLDGHAEAERDRPLIEEAAAAFLRALAIGRRAAKTRVARVRRSARRSPDAEIEEAQIP